MCSQTGLSQLEVASQLITKKGKLLNGINILKKFTNNISKRI